MRFHVVHRHDSNSEKVCETIVQRCIEKGWNQDENHPELLISVGGDGTLLRAIHSYIDQLDSMCFVGIHTGTLGFFTDYIQDELDMFLSDILTKEPDIEAFPMLEVTLPQKEETYYAFNEARVANLEKTLNLNIYIDEELFEKTTGSGICISTQFGSTAINRALGGAVVDPGLQVMQLTEVLPVSHSHHHTLGNPYIMKKDRQVLVKGKDLKEATLGYDHLSTSLDGVSEIRIATSRKKVRFARYRTYSYLRRLKNLY